jgi:DNA-binding CsgD family transcriptional regulator
VLSAYRTQATRPMANPPKVHLTPKELLIVSCVAQGMKNKEIAQRVNTTEQVVKNYLRKVYDKLGVSDRLELALYCLHHRLLDAAEPGTPAEQAPAGNHGHGQAAVSAKAGVHDGVGNLVGDLVGMSLGDRFRSEKVTITF